ncbi:MAG TPA: hypothetical protein VGJ90_08110 [Methylophilaceae bacterium]|jgi:hypothetical protein
MSFGQSSYVHFPKTKVLINTTTGSQDHKYLQLSILLFGAFEFFLGLVSYMAADYVDLFIPLIFVAGGLGALALIFCVWQPASIKVYDILAVALMLAYGVGSLNTLVSFMAENATSELSYFIPQIWLVRAVASCVASAGLLHMAGRADSQGYIFKHFELTESQVKKILIFCMLFGVLFLIQVAKGSIGFMGIQNAEDTVQISAVASLVSGLLTPVSSLAIYAAFQAENIKRKRFLLLIAATFLLFQFFLGRRVFIFSSFILVMTIVFANRPKKFITLKNILMLCILVFALQTATTAFLTLRLAGYSHFVKHTGKGSVALKDRLQAAYQLYMESENGEIAESVKENLKTRTFVIDYFASLSEKASYKEPMLGQDFFRALIVATPSIIYPGKYANKLYGQEEGLANPYYGLPVDDNANSILTAGVIDFGLLGVFVLPLATCIVFSLILRARNYGAAAMGAALVGIMTCQTMLSVEADYVGYITSLRDITIVLILTAVYLLLTKKLPNHKIQNLKYKDN